MKSLKDETDGLYAVINKYEEATKESNRQADQADCDIRDFGKKVHSYEIDFDETTDKLNKANEQFEETLGSLLVVFCVALLLVVLHTATRAFHGSYLDVAI